MTVKHCDCINQPAAVHLKRVVQMIQATRRLARALLLALLVSMATSAPSNIVLSPFDNPFALLGMRRTSVEAALNMANKDFEKAYRMASKILHPDKV